MESEQTIQLEPQYYIYDVETINIENPSETISPNNRITPDRWGTSYFSYIPWVLGSSESRSNISKPKTNLTQYFFELDPNIFRSQETCSICLNEFEDLSVNNEEKVENKKTAPNKLDNTNNICKLECSHHFHIGCVENWLTKHATCPNCRTKCKINTDLVAVLDN
jgi:hypothetical protein